MTSGTQRAFTLIEAITLTAAGTLALCLALPIAFAGASGGALSARPEGFRMAELTRGIAMYAADRGTLPPSFAFGADATSSNWNLQEQGAAQPNPANGYVHWSAWLMQDYGVPEDACAADNVPGGGAPRPNPGADASNWEAWQQDELGQTRVTAGALPQDRMARRMAYTANRALMPRNRLVPSGSLRHDELVAPALVSNPSRTILLAEWWHTTAAGWQTVSIDARSRAHWPVNPFIGATSGTNPYNEGVTGTFARFGYPALSRVLPASGDGFEAIADSGTELSAVARQRPKNSSFFAMLDGSVQRMSVSRSITQRLWGDRFWSISGNDRVQP